MELPFVLIDRHIPIAFNKSIIILFIYDRVKKVTFRIIIQMNKINISQ